jgi:hypothetical protein
MNSVLIHNLAVGSLHSVTYVDMLYVVHSSLDGIISGGLGLEGPKKGSSP